MYVIVLKVCFTVVKEITMNEQYNTEEYPIETDHVLEEILELNPELAQAIRETREETDDYTTKVR